MIIQSYHNIRNQTLYKSLGSKAKATKAKATSPPADVSVAKQMLLCQVNRFDSQEPGFGSISSTVKVMGKS